MLRGQSATPAPSVAEDPPRLMPDFTLRPSGAGGGAGRPAEGTPRAEIPAGEEPGTGATTAALSISDTCLTLGPADPLRPSIRISRCSDARRRIANDRERLLGTSLPSPSNVIAPRG